MKQPTKEQLDEAYKLQTEYYELCKNQKMDRREWIEARQELWEKMLLKLASLDRDWETLLSQEIWSLPLP